MTEHNSMRQFTSKSHATLQIQHRDRIMNIHGANFIKHDSMASPEEKVIFGNFKLSRAAAAPDLHQTPVHEGLGTGESDPYTRTLPNQESMPPESTVLESGNAQVATTDEVARLTQRWDSLRYWLSETHPRLPLYVNKLCCQDELPVSPSAHRLCEQFLNNVLPQMMEGQSYEKLAEVQALWTQIETTFHDLVLKHIFDKQAFTKELRSLHENAEQTISKIIVNEEVKLALEVIRRKAVIARNKFITNHFLSLLQNAPYFMYADGIWRIFFEAVHTYKSSVFVDLYDLEVERGNNCNNINNIIDTNINDSNHEHSTNNMLAFAWEAIQLEDVVRMPTMTAPVALFLTMTSLLLEQEQELQEQLLSPYQEGNNNNNNSCAGGGDDVSMKSNERTENGARESNSDTTHLTTTSTDKMNNTYKGSIEHEQDTSLRSNASPLSSAWHALEPRYENIEPIKKRHFVMQTLRAILRDEKHCNSLSRALQTIKFNELARRVELCESINAQDRLNAEDCSVVMEQFHPLHVNEVMSLLAAITRGSDEVVRQHIASVFGLTTEQLINVNWNELFRTIDYQTHWHGVAMAILQQDATVHAMFTFVRNSITARNESKALFNQGFARSLQELLRQREQRAAVMGAQMYEIVRPLSSYEHVDSTLRMLIQHHNELEVDLSVLDNELKTLQSRYHHQLKTAGQRTVVKLESLNVVLDAVRRRHPTWVNAHVIPRHVQIRTPLQALQVMVRIFVRLSYLPQTGAAAIAERTRRRIGKVGTASHEFNIPGEMGFVEHYNNLLYKRYDWQGWYQRMVDIHNRNVSIRCRIDDLKRLDGNGLPFTDMQTERRLRILAADRVGMGVVKLDSDKYEDQSDNITHGTGKLLELLADARKAQLGLEYWPTVEVKVRKPSGQSQAHYSLVDYDRIEQKSRELYSKYRDAKRQSLFVTPMNLWLEVKGAQGRRTSDHGDAEGYTVDNLAAELANEVKDNEGD